MLAGHRSSYVPTKLVVEIQRGAVTEGSTIPVNTYITDEFGARILTATNQIHLSCAEGTFSQPSGPANQGLSKTSMTVHQSLSAGEYKIKAISNGLVSGRTYFTVFDDTGTSVPSVPKGLIAQTISDSQIKLSWQPSNDDVQVAGYRIYRNSSFVADHFLTNYVDSNLSSSTTYTYTIKAYDGARNESDFSLSASAATGAGQSNPSTNETQFLAYPNPGRDQIHFLIHLEQAAIVKIGIYNSVGEQISLLTEYLEAGNNQIVSWNCLHYSPGIYFAKLIRGGIETQILKIAVIR